MLTFREESGQGLTEYGLILFFIAIVIVLILSVMGGQIGNLFSQVTNAFP